jgi:hypothetical protein
MNLRDRIAALEQEEATNPGRIIAEWQQELAHRQHDAAVRICNLIQAHVREDEDMGLALGELMVKSFKDTEDKPLPNDTRLTEWISDIALGNEVLPEDISADAFRELIRQLVAVAPQEQDWGFKAVCDRCGVALWDHDKAGDCPNCHCAEWTWNSRLDEQPHPWQAGRMKTFNERFAEAHLRAF